MKTNIKILGLIFFFAVAPVLQSMGQEKSKDVIQKEIDIQKKAMVDQKKTQEDIQIDMENQDKELEEAMQEARDNMPHPGEFDNYRMRVNRTPFDNNYVFRSYNFDTSHSLGDNESSSWNFSKSVKESSFSGNYTFQVEKSARTVVMNVTGDCEKGEIRIKIVMPGGKTYSEIVVDESGNLNWRKSFNISDDENKDKTGEWKYDIKASDATGFFRISLQTF